MAFDVLKAQKAGYSESDIVDFLASEKNFDAAKARETGYTNADLLNYLNPKEEKESPLRQVADIPLKVTEGVVSGVRMLSDVFGADNPISKSLRGVEDYVGSLLSAQAKNDQKEIARIMKEAEDKGVLEQIKAGFFCSYSCPCRFNGTGFWHCYPNACRWFSGCSFKGWRQNSRSFNWCSNGYWHW